MIDNKAAHNSTYKKLAVQWLNEALCFVSSSVVADSLVLRNPLLRQAPKRYAVAYHNIRLLVAHELTIQKSDCNTIYFSFDNYSLGNLGNYQEKNIWKNSRILLARFAWTFLSWDGY